MRRRFLVTTFVVGLSGGMTVSFVAILASELGASDLLAGIVTASAALALLLVDAFGSRAILRLDARRSIAAGCAIFGIGSALSAVAPAATLVLAGRCLQGFGAALFMGSSLQLAVRLAPRGREPHAIGVYNAVWFCGIAFGPLAGGAVSQVAGIRAAFAVCALTSFAGAATARLLLPPGSLLPGASSRGEPQRPAFGLLRLPNAGARFRCLLVLGAACQGLRGGLPLTLVPLFAADELGLSALGVGLVATVLAVADIVAMWLSALVADRLGHVRTLGTGLLVGAVGASVIALDPTTPALLIACAMIGVAVGTAWVVSAAIALDAAIDTESGVAAFRIASDIGMLGGSVAGGAILTVAAGAAAFAWTAAALVALAIAASATGWSRPRLSGRRTGEGWLAPLEPSPRAVSSHGLPRTEGQSVVAHEADDRLEVNARLRPGLEQLRAASMPFLEPVIEPTSSLAWLENGGRSPS